ncbi:MAG: hypothetical protein JWO06_2594 [Bacteroidota bacterium]|nr:hypothetical protein [Bacteroidota bacterium]
MRKIIIAESTIPGSGKGLFAAEDIKRGQAIVQITGPRHTPAEIENMVRDEYLLEAGDGSGDCIDVQGPAMYANDAKGITRVEGLANNAVFRPFDDGTMWIEATKNIKAEQEILVGYGKYYWDVIKERFTETSSSKN